MKFKNLLFFYGQDGVSIEFSKLIILDFVRTHYYFRISTVIAKALNIQTNLFMTPILVYICYYRNLARKRGLKSTFYRQCRKSIFCTKKLHFHLVMHRRAKCQFNHLLEVVFFIANVV